MLNKVEVFSDKILVFVFEKQIWFHTGRLPLDASLVK